MKKIPKVLTFAFTFSAAMFAFAANSKAVCPVCTVAVGAGLGLSRYLGIDDAVSGVWLGGLILSLSLWSTNWLKKKDFKLPHLALFSLVLWLAITLIPLILSGVIGHPYNTIYGIDKLIFGVFTGILVFLLSIKADKKVRQIRGKQMFDYQKVVFPIIFLLTASIIMFTITK